MDHATGYRERRSTALPAISWSRWCEPGASIVRPDGCIDLIWDGRRVLVAGPDTVARRHETTAPVTLTAIRLAPGVAPIVTGLPAAQLRDRQLRLDDVLGEDAPRWEELIAGSATPGATLEALAVEALRHRGGVPGWIAPTVAAIRMGTRIDDVADHLGLGTRQLRRRCDDAFGYGPKTLHRILRVEDASRSLREGVSLTDTAHRHGYSDYSHMFREFRAVTGSSPSDVAAPPHDDVAQRSTGLPSGSSTTAYR
ncbi:helix-turn-helix domain-containing protein [Williamsia sp. M5A3_1d]